LTAQARKTVAADLFGLFDVEPMPATGTGYHQYLCFFLYTIYKNYQAAALFFIYSFNFKTARINHFFLDIRSVNLYFIANSNNC